MFESVYVDTPDKLYRLAKQPFAAERGYLPPLMGPCGGWRSQLAVPIGETLFRGGVGAIRDIMERPVCALDGSSPPGLLHFEFSNPHSLPRVTGFETS